MTFPALLDFIIQFLICEMETSLLCLMSGTTPGVLLGAMFLPQSLLVSSLYQRLLPPTGKIGTELSTTEVN